MKSQQAGARRVEMSQASLLALLLLTQLSCNKVGPGSPIASSEHELLGARAPGFELPAQSGSEPLSLEDHAGKLVIVDFWATWCAPCKESFPFYQSLTEKYAGQVVVLAISVDEEPGGISAFVRDTGASFPVGWDEGQDVARLYEPVTMPTSYLIDRQGVVQFVHAGFKSGDEEAIVHHLEQMLKSR